MNSADRRDQFLSKHPLNVVVQSSDTGCLSGVATCWDTFSGRLPLSFTSDLFSGKCAHSSPHVAVQTLKFNFNRHGVQRFSLQSQG